MPEQLKYFRLEQKYVKLLKEEDKPYYTEYEKRLIAWSIVWEGSVLINKRKRKNRISYSPQVSISNTEFEVLEQFQRIAKLGKVSPTPYKPKGRRAKQKPYKTWRITNYHAIFFILSQISPFITSKRKYQCAKLTIEFCRSRIKQHETSRQIYPYTEREIELAEKVIQLNKRGLP